MGTLTQSLKNMIASAAQAAGVPVGLYTGLVQQESNFNANAVSSAGAIGYSQLMPGTALDLGANAYDPQSNLNGGAKYLKQMYDKFGNWGDAVAAYNAGPAGWSAVLKGTKNVPAETAAYVPAVMGYAKQYGFDVNSKGQNVVKSPLDAADQANASQGVSSDQGTSFIGSILGQIFGPALPNVGLATPLWGNQSPPNAAQAVANDPNDPLNSSAGLVASIQKFFSAEFWQSAATFIVVMIVAAAFLIFGASRIVKS